MSWLTLKSFYILQSCLINKKTNTDLDLNFLFNVERALFHVFLQSQFKMCHPDICNGLRRCSLPNAVLFIGSLRVSFSIWKGYLIARGKRQPSKTGCPEEEHAGIFVCFPIEVHCGYFTHRVSSGEVLKLGLNREMLVKLVAAAALK